MKKVLYVVGGIILVIVVISLMTGDPDLATEEETETIEDEVFSVGDRIDHENRVLTVNSVERAWTSSNQFDTPSSGNEYVVIDITLENESDDEVSFNPFHFEIKDGNGVISDTGFGGVGIDTLSSGDLAPGGQISGKLVFEVGENALDDLTLFYEPGFWSERVEVKL